MKVESSTIKTPERVLTRQKFCIYVRFAIKKVGEGAEFLVNEKHSIACLDDLNSANTLFSQISSIPQLQSTYRLQLSSIKNWKHRTGTVTVGIYTHVGEAPDDVIQIKEVF